MRLAILQSNYIPWKGYFDLMAMSDLFIVYDSVQYTKNDWRNRNRLMSEGGPIWLTIPVATAGRSAQAINEARINDPRWARKHWTTISQTLARRPHFDDFRSEWQAHYDAAERFELLHDVNVHFMRMLARQLGVTTEVVDDRTFSLRDDSPTGKLVQLCVAVGATSYVTGPAGLNYLDVDRFHEAGVQLEVIDYGHYAEYLQGDHDFRHDVSVLDLMASVGVDAAGHLLGRIRQSSANG